MHRWTSETTETTFVNGGTSRSQQGLVSRNFEVLKNYRGYTNYPIELVHTTWTSANLACSSHSCQLLLPLPVPKKNHHHLENNNKKAQLVDSMRKKTQRCGGAFLKITSRSTAKRRRRSLGRYDEKKSQIQEPVQPVVRRRIKRLPAGRLCRAARNVRFPNLRPSWGGLRDYAAACFSSQWSHVGCVVTLWWPVFWNL